MKKLLLTTVLSIIFASSTAFAQNAKFKENQSLDKESYPVHVSDRLNNSEVMKKLKAIDSQTPTRQKSMLVVDEVGDERTFFVNNFETNDFDSYNFRLVRKGELTQIWFEIGEIENGHLNDAVADSIFKYLEEESNRYSFNPNKGIIELSNEYLGTPPNYDGDNLVDFLITDVRDGWSPEEGGGYTAGFFYGVDQFTDQQAQASGARSNERDILYIDSYPGIFSNGEADATRPLGTLSHEYQHLIHYNYDNNELTFINEAQSNFASLLSGYVPYSLSQYLSNTNVPIFQWDREGDVFSDYSRAAMFTSYMWDQLGFENSGELTQNGQRGRFGVESAFSNLNAPFTFEEFLVNWGIANLVNDKSQDEKYGYEHPFLENAKAQVSFQTPNLINRSISVKAGGIKYYGFQEVKDVTVNVTSGAPTGEMRVVAVSEGDVTVTTLTSGQDYTTPAGALYNQFYVMLVNTDTESSNSSFTVNVNGEQSYELTTVKTFGQTPKFYWAVPYENDSGVGRLGFSNKFTVGFDALVHSLQLFIVSGEDGSTGETIGVKGEGDLRIAVYDDSNGNPGTALAADTVSFSEIGSNWQTFNVTDWDLTLDQGQVIHVVYELIVPTLNSDINSIPLRLDDGNGPQSVTKIVTAPGEFATMFTDSESGGEHGVWNRLILAESLVTSTEDPGVNQPNAFKLSQNYPNPFNPTTNIDFSLPAVTNVQIDIYSMLGQKVATLVNSPMSAGTHSVTWDASNMASGVYIYKIVAGDFTQTRKMLLLK
ncbi:T9SS type A sorting domain-containing protein [Gracilimonas sp.]|uniref:T9SS type A sorting domain-containing protein n=1 Tax=Gracilimonas sp. TaxID=1974203 RepID=UPI0032EE73DD